MSSLAERLAQSDVASISHDGDAAAYLNSYADPTLPSAWSAVRIVDARSVFRKTFQPGSSLQSPGGPTTALVALQDAAADAQHPVRNVARAALELFKDEDGTIDAADDEERTIVLSLLGALVQGGILSEAAYSRIEAMMERAQTWPEAFNGGVPLTARDVGIARGGAA